MKRVLQWVLGLEIFVALLWVLLVATTRKADGFGLLGWFFVIYALFAVMFVVALIACWAFPAGRKLSIYIMVLPVIAWFLPMGLQALAGGPVSTAGFGVFVALLAAACFALCWFVPRRAAAFFPDRLVRSGLFNWLIILAMIAGWLLLFLSGMYLWNNERPSSTTNNPGWAIAYGIVFVSIYVTGLGLASFGASTWAWVSLRGGIETATRKLNIAQLIVAAPGIIATVAIALFLGSQS